MNKYFFAAVKAVISTLGVLVLSSTGAMAHDLQEALNMVDQGSIDTHLMYVKYTHDASTDATGRKNFMGLFKASHSFWNAREFSSGKLFGKIQNPRLSKYQFIEFKKDLSKAEAKEALRLLFQRPDVEYGFFHPKVSDAVINTLTLPVIHALPPELALNATPDFQPRQDYLKAAPVGVDAEFAWAIPGGTGKNVKIIDVETGWFIKHEDLRAPFWLGKESESTFTDHGAAVAGELVGTRDGKGITGISYDSQFGFIRRDAPFGNNDYHANMALALETAVQKLNAGDLLVLELHSVGPTNNFLPVEFWEPVFDILQVARDKGVLCVAAAGNGGTNLESPILKGAFDLSKRDSGCIIVGASTHQSQGAGYNTASFSNYGPRVDAFGFGENVVTAGYGDMQNEKEKTYTAQFSGTSSATPIVGGTIAVLSSIAKERGKLLKPADLRNALRKTGTHLIDNTKPIGNLPDLASLYKLLF